MIELYDPLAVNDISVNGVQVPLESDLTTPLAYFLSNPAMENFDTSTVGLLHPDSLSAQATKTSRPIVGLYMVQPYQPGKIPVFSGPRPLAQPHDLDADVQRLAEFVRKSATATSSGFTCTRPRNCSG